jgi:hypothetical protein
MTALLSQQYSTNQWSCLLALQHGFVHATTQAALTFVVVKAGELGRREAVVV